MDNGQTVIHKILIKLPLQVQIVYNIQNINQSNIFREFQTGEEPNTDKSLNTHSIY